MADVMLSVAAERLITLIEAEVKHHFNLVRGAEKEVRSLAKKLVTIRNVLDDAENRRFQNKSINSWLSKLEQTSYEMEDILDEWNYALLKLQREEHRPDDAGAPGKKVFSFITSSPCLCFKKTGVRHHIATKILNVKARLDDIFKEKDQFDFVISQPLVDDLPEPRRDQSTSSIYLRNVHGRDSEGDILVSKLLANVSRQEESGIPVVSIVGVGGLGKTTLAQLVYNHSRVEEFFDLRIWVCVSDPFDLDSIAKGILESIENGSSRDADQLDVLLKRVGESILGKKFLIVLDDVWTENYKKWEPLENILRGGGVGSKILVTTRSKRVAITLGTSDSEILQLGVLSDKDCFLVLCCMAALSERERVQFEDIGKKIAQKCSGLPLAATTLGGLLCFKRSLRDWENVLNSEIWKMQEVEDELFHPLLMSYKELSVMQKRCFSYCAVFPKDSMIDIENLIGNWMALGYLGSNKGDMELKGKECFDVLAMRSLFQNFEYSQDELKFCKMHDIVHDFAQFIRKSGRVEATEKNKATCRDCDPKLVSTVNELCSFCCRVISEYPPNLCDCLVRLRVLSFTKYSLQSNTRGIDKLIHLRWLNLSWNILSTEDLKIIFHLYYLQTLILCYCGLAEIPKEIENLSELRHLNIESNQLKNLPSEIGNLKQLRHLDLSENGGLYELPNEIGKLVLLQVLRLPRGNQCLPVGLAQLTDLRTLDEFRGGIGWSTLGLLKNLSQLGIVSLRIKLDRKYLKDMVEDAREAELSNKMHIEKLHLSFEDEMDEEELSSSLREMMDLIDALVPHPNLRILFLGCYKGSKLPLGWIISPFGQLPCLEEIYLYRMDMVQFVGREFWGVTATTTEGDHTLNVQYSSNTDVIAFPKLKTLEFHDCGNWKEWEDITTEEEESATFQVMPCLTNLRINSCKSLTELPHRLLRKTSLMKLDVSYSMELLERYDNQEYPHLQLIKHCPCHGMRHPMRLQNC